MEQMSLVETFWQYAKPEAKFTKDQLRAEVGEAYEGIVQALATTFACDPETLDKCLGGSTHCVIGCFAYEYAVNGSLNLDVLSFNHIDEAFLDYLAFLTQAQNANEFYAEGCVPSANKHIALMAFVRFKLDEDTHPDWGDEYTPTVYQNYSCGVLTLKEIALLAQMTEKAVRNATQPSASDRLYTLKQGARTVVDSHEALRWLKGRRNFIPTSIN